MLRRTALVATLLVLLSVTSAAAATTTITITDYAYPPSTSIHLGDTVKWSNQHITLHSTTGDSPLKLWSHDIPVGHSVDVTFAQAGTFAFHCRIHPDLMFGVIRVPLKVTPFAGSASTTFTVRVATVRAPAGFSYVIQRRAGSGSFKAWKVTTSPTAAFKPGHTGTWTFRSRLKRLSNGGTSGWSPTATITVH